MSDTVTVELTAHEARALLRAAEFSHSVFVEALGPHICPLPVGHEIHPVESATLKLETALVIEQAER